MASLNLYQVEATPTDILLREVVDDTPKYTPSYDIFLFQSREYIEGGTIPTPPKETILVVTKRRHYWRM